MGIRAARFVCSLDSRDMILGVKKWRENSFSSRVIFIKLRDNNFIFNY